MARHRMNLTHDTSMCWDLPLKKYGIPSSFTATASISRPWQRSRTAAEYHVHEKLERMFWIKFYNEMSGQISVAKMIVNTFHQLTWCMCFLPEWTEKRNEITLIAQYKAASDLKFNLKSKKCTFVSLEFKNLIIVEKLCCKMFLSFSPFPFKN